MTGTFLVRSGILNSVHTFANDPSRGLFILVFLISLSLLSLVIFFLFRPSNVAFKYFNFFSKETSIIVNNWFMMFFLISILIGTVYPIFLEVINGSKISVGSPFYNFIIIPFVAPFLIFMTFGPKLGWIQSDFKKLIRDKKNHDYLNRIYFELGQYYYEKDFLNKALNNYKISIQKFNKQFGFCATTAHKMTHDTDIHQRTDNIWNMSIYVDPKLTEINANDFKLVIHFVYTAQNLYKLNIKQTLNLYKNLANENP